MGSTRQIEHWDGKRMADSSNEEFSLFSNIHAGYRLRNINLKQYYIMHILLFEDFEVIFELQVDASTWMEKCKVKRPSELSIDE